ncbi:MAG TPA: cytochrome c oxidase subunit 3 [Solirubrobacteraceae bacterium]|nr:cytochrome c oxidase subunit 3 [Solirubrobacteraceae bacterium]
MAEAAGSIELGQVPAVQHGVEIPPEPPEVGGRQLFLGARMLAGSAVFFFLAFGFAYFYLRSLDVEHMWKPKGVSAPEGWGAAIVIVLVASGLLAIAAGRMMGKGSRAPQAGWLNVAALSLVLGLTAVVLQCIEWATLSFGPASGAYASVFCGWTALYTLMVLGALYWLEIHVATELRARRHPAPHGDVADPDRLIQPGLDAAVFFWSFTVGLGIIAWVILYPISS